MMMGTLALGMMASTKKNRTDWTAGNGNTKHLVDERNDWDVQRVELEDW
jgi:hypothetical protein